MRLATVLRVSGVWYLLPALGLVIWLLVPGNSWDFAPGYGVVLVSQAAVAVFFAGPAGAGAAAWQVGRLRRGRILDRGAHRPFALILLDTVWPILLTVLCGLLLGLGIAAREQTWSTPSWPMLGTLVLVLVGHTLVGAALGAVLPPFVATPLVMMLSFLWLAFPSGMGPGWFNHTNGAFQQCCTIAETYSRSSLVAALVFGVGLILGAFGLLLFRLQRPAVRAAALLVPVLVAAAASYGFVGEPTGSRGNDRAPVQARPYRPVCETRTVVVCMWPEHTRGMPLVQQTAASVLPRWRSAGVPVPLGFTEENHDGMLRFGYSAESTPDSMLYSFVSGYLPDPVPCLVRGGDSRAQAAVAGREERGIWLLLVSGGSEQLARRHADAVIVDRVRAVRKRPLDAQRAWFTRGISEVLACGERDR